MEGKGLRARLMDAMAAMENPQKSRTAEVPTKSGGRYTYRYETLEEVLEIVKPALFANGLSLLQGQDWDENAGCFVLVTAVEDGEDAIVLDKRPMKAMQDAQQAGSYETYMRRYALRTAFGLAAEDDDGAAAKRPPRATAEQVEAIMEAVAEFAELRGKGTGEVVAALVASKTGKALGVKGTDLERLDQRQAGELLEVVRVWAEKAREEALADEDIAF